MDYTSGIFDLANSVKRMATTLARQVAYFVTIYSGMTMAADRPFIYEERFPEVFEFIRAVPTNFEKTLPLLGEIGEYYVVARKDRESADWFLGGVTNENSRRVHIDLDFLDFSKQSLINMPTIDFDATTIVIAGFPNVGKSTLLKQITGADPQVANYPFTTKGIQIGHTEIRWRNIQIIDTPGLLDRPVLEMNDIEMNAIVALEHLADAILFIFDASETCGFHLDNQYNLLKQIEKIFGEIPVYYLFNKMDLVEDREYLNDYIDDIDRSIFISAIEGDGVDEINKLIGTIKKIDRTVEEEDDDYY